MSTLVIVESPAKAKIIQGYLKSIDPSKTWQVIASYGHVRDLQPKEIGIDLDNNFEAKYSIIDGKMDKVKAITAAAKNAKMVYLASDNDREGEAIAWHIKEVLKLPASRCKRMVFNEITQNALRESVNNLKPDINMALVDAQVARRFIDRIMGFKLSPLLWKNFKTTNGTLGLSAGRVQSATLKIIIDKEKQIEAHDSSPYWSSKGDFTLKGFNFEDARLYHVGDEESGVAKFNNEKEAKKFLAGLKNEWSIIKSKISNSKDTPPPPFITSTMQQEAYSIGMDVKTTMRFAQELYEHGLITYMRTDSPMISNDAKKNIKAFVISTFGEGLYEDRDYSKRKSKNAQEAHEAIRPTNVNTRDAEAVRAKLKQGFKKGHWELYELIWRRTVASQMKAAQFVELQAHIADSSFKKKFAYIGKIKCLKYAGYRVLRGEKADASGVAALTDANTLFNDGKAHTLPIKCTSVVMKNTWTSAPSRYNESTLVKSLEDNGIGRPSTYANILGKLYEKQYINKQNTVGKTHKCIDFEWNPKNKQVTNKEYETTINAETSRIVPTDIGRQINEFLMVYVPDLIEQQFTAQMEDALDDIASGSIEKIKVLKSFWNQLKPRIESATAVIGKGDKVTLESSKKVYDVDGEEYVVRLGMYGPVIHRNETVKIKVAKGEKKPKQSMIGLKPYLALTKKSYLDMRPEEVEFFVRLPMSINGYELKYARYGFYITKDGQSYSIVPSFIRKNTTEDGVIKIEKLASLSKDDLQSLVEAKEKYQKKKQGLHEDGSPIVKKKYTRKSAAAGKEVIKKLPVTKKPTTRKQSVA